MVKRKDLPASSIAARFRQRLFHPWRQPASEVARLPAGVAPRRQLTFQASIAEFLLINRLRARRPAAPSTDVLERAARIVFVTCKNWFAPAENRNVSHRTRL